MTGADDRGRLAGWDCVPVEDFLWNLGNPFLNAELECADIDLWCCRTAV